MLFPLCHLRLVLIASTVAAPCPSQEILRTECPVQHRQLSQLKLSQLILPVGNHQSGVDDLGDLLHSLLDDLLVGAGDVGVEGFILAGQRTLSRLQLSLLDGALPTNDYLSTGLRFQRFQRVATRADQQADEVDFGVVVLRDPHLIVKADVRGAEKGN